MTPSASAPAIVWACFMGCATPERLAAEWSIPVVEATRLLRRAERAGDLVRDGRGRYGLPRFRSRNGPVARLRAMMRDPCQRFTTRKTA